ncbi:signal peptide peptidase-domain-containing protein [Chaetomidium leptoderma]|uniref:Signal peptide peptidase-domain-containing protein n=1 Tax=Chaetomidium leptoderma TaxID=669021 RepID=A0AAN6VK79_9PEZI|nr:signal peptide peptidase-domain-containing protein [Chaetomidium leptoderma]
MSSTGSTPDVANISSPSPPATNNISAPPIFAFARLLEPQYLLIVFSALGIIWLGAHGALRRPPSAASPKLKKGEKKREEEKFTEGLVASDAIRFPIMLAAVLVGLYYLIQWLQDPAILNKVLRGYMSIMSIAGLGTLAGDVVDNLTSLIFPTMWADGNGQVYRIDPQRRCQYVVSKETGEETIIEGKDTPLPGWLSNLASSTSSKWFLWELRHLLTEEWTVRAVVYGKPLVKFELRANDLLRFTIAGAVAVAYHLTGWNALSNLLSLAMCYASFMMFSPTSFNIGTMVLASLFVYDVVMVFYTPYMITVAKNIDAPIKLVFTSAKGASMLGLGDIVVPGMLMALALRFDLFQYYQRQTKLEPIQLTTETASDVASSETTATTTTTTTTTTQHRRIKAPYVDTRGQWGNRFWTTPLGHLSPVREATDAIAATAFPKPYFYASVVGYAAGMFVTLTVMLVFNHGQPALLYLVPGVTGALWLTGLRRGELKDMWGYTEDGSLDVEDVVVEVDGEGRVVKESGGKKKEEEKKGEGEKKEGSEKSKDEVQGAGEVEDEGAPRLRDGHHELFLFSVTAPRAAATIS